MTFFYLTDGKGKSCIPLGKLSNVKEPYTLILLLGQDTPPPSPTSTSEGEKVMNEAGPCGNVYGSVWLILYLSLFLDSENHAAQAGPELPVFLPLRPGCWWAPGVHHTIQFTLQKESQAQTFERPMRICIQENVHHYLSEPESPHLI